MNGSTAASRIHSILYVNSHLIREEGLDIKQYLDDGWKCHFKVQAVTGSARNYVRLYLFTVPGDYKEAIVFEVTKNQVKVISLGRYGEYHNDLQRRLNGWLNQHKNERKNEPSAMIRRRVKVIDRLNDIWDNISDPDKQMNGALQVRSRIDLERLGSKFYGGGWEMCLAHDDKHSPRIKLRNVETNDAYLFRIIRGKAVSMVAFRYAKNCKLVAYDLNRWLYKGSIKIDTEYYN